MFLHFLLGKLTVAPILVLTQVLRRKEATSRQGSPSLNEPTQAVEEVCETRVQVPDVPTASAKRGVLVEEDVEKPFQDIETGLQDMETPVDKEESPKPTTIPHETAQVQSTPMAQLPPKQEKLEKPEAHDKENSLLQTNRKQRKRLSLESTPLLNHQTMTDFGVTPRDPRFHKACKDDRPVVKQARSFEARLESAIKHCERKERKASPVTFGIKE